MEDFTVHKLNDNLLVSLYPLPGFERLGVCVIRDDEGNRSGGVTVYYTGKYFCKAIEPGSLAEATRQIKRLCQNYAIRKNVGKLATRLNFTTYIRNKLALLCQQSEV